MSSLGLNQEDYQVPKQRRRRRTGWPLAEAKGIPEADRRAIQSAIAEWEGRTKGPAAAQGRLSSKDFRM
jgi:hypothetical protein